MIDFIVLALAEFDEASVFATIDGTFATTTCQAAL